jgi:hypothetical protein
VRSYEEWREARWPTIRARSWDEVHALRERATTPPAPQREFLLPLRGAVSVVGIRGPAHDRRRELFRYAWPLSSDGVTRRGGRHRVQFKR